MDTSFWIQYNPNIIVDHPTKKYFGRYLYRLTILAYGGRLIDSKGSISADKQRRVDLTTGIHSHSWFSYRNRNIEQADVDLLIQLRELKHDRKELGILVRIEEPHIQIYTDSNEKLQEVVKKYFAGFEHYVISVSGPENLEAEQALNSGAIIRKKDNGYRYKVILRDGRYTFDLKSTVLNYLSNLGDAVQIPTSTVMMLRKESGYIWNCYFFTNDINITSFITLISPGLVSNYHELVTRPDK